MSDWPSLALAFVLGATISIYQPMNAMVARHVGSPLLANLLFYLFAVGASLALLLLFGAGGGLRQLRSLPPVLLLAGIMSAFMVLGTIALLPKLGARRLFLLQVAGQILMAMLVGHFGLLGLPADALSGRKLLGAVLILLGAVVSMG
jgi:transporter family-2 protein